MCSFCHLQETKVIFEVSGERVMISKECKTEQESAFQPLLSPTEMCNLEFNVRAVIKFIFYFPLL